jgi:hypothetical protein
MYVIAESIKLSFLNLFDRVECLTNLHPNLSPLCHWLANEHPSTVLSNYFAFEVDKIVVDSIFGKDHQSSVYDQNVRTVILASLFIFF